MINARVETVAERPAYRGAFERFRCLVLADGFYEWRRARASGGSKQAFRITRAGRRLFAFAGLWSIWRGGRTADAAHVHDPHHGRQRRSGTAARPDAGDPARRRRGGLARSGDAAARSFGELLAGLPAAETALHAGRTGGQRRALRRPGVPGAAGGERPGDAVLEPDRAEHAAPVEGGRASTR